MAQNLFDFAGTANRSYTLLDSNFSENYDLRNKVWTPAYAPATYAFAIDASLRTIFGYSAAVTFLSTNIPSVQNHGTTISGSANANVNWANGSTGVRYFFGKSRSGTLGSHASGVLSAGDTIMEIRALGSDGTDFIQCAQYTISVDGTTGTNVMPGRHVFATTPDGGSSVSEALRIDRNQAVLCSSPTGGLGYRTGAGGTVTQTTSKSNGVTLNTVCGQVTMNNASLAANTAVTFTLTNSAISTGDRIIVNHMSGGTFGVYAMDARAASGSATVMLRNLTGGSLSEAVVLGFTVIRSVTS